MWRHWPRKIGQVQEFGVDKTYEKLKKFEVLLYYIKWYFKGG